MTLDDFLEMSDRRLPNADEMVALCKELGIRFGTDAEGRPALKVQDDNRSEGQLIAKLIRREPWRSQIIEACIREKEREDQAEVETELEVPEETKPAPNQEPDFSRRVTIMGHSGIVGMVINPEEWKAGNVAWRYYGETGWRPIAGKEHLFPSNVERFSE